MSDNAAPPTREELLARLQNLKQRAESLQDQLAARSRPKPGVVARRLGLLIGVSLAAAIGIYVATSSILFAVLALVVAPVIVLAIALRLTPGAPGPGSRAWESQHTAMLLVDVIASRRGERATTTDDSQRARIDREIAFLSTQLDEHRAIAASGDRSPGRGYVGFEPYSGE